ncbi:cytochrome P450 reductase 1 [Aureobasidium pullulans]|uniref:NADPH--cytochrome P450 reductase n=1 Tax=Aureobasidium pullulans TaxID=5580 RepID=A0A4V4KT67_AURPU|nr:cytochrome P450 reductase 1 [Aureobasidium pullulans]THZ34940.1 cytochrome P450 reductase 1 [Aureobasidium pullulans]THZ52611.1 cytochrome P450 reductase 1 [Aureobasidium pullulans]THZ92946.1 cytochrome P450 reductase 1 [Aureobasidium pullulans]
MATTFPSNPAFNNVFSHLSKNAGLEDIAAMALVGAASAAYMFKGTLWDKPDPYLYKWFERPQELMGGRAGAQQTRNIAEKLEETGADMIIFWGSQSGTAQRMANRLAKECHQRFGVKALSVDASDYEASTIAQIPRAKLAIFMASTYGEGEPPDSYHELWSWLHATSDKSLAEMKYMAFGLGNSNYKHYNEVIKVVVGRLDALGAQPLLPTGMADDAQGETEEHYLEWKEQVFKTFSTQLGYTERDPTYEPSLKVFEDESLEPIDLNHGVPAEKSSDRKTNHGMSAVYSLPVKGARELFQVSEHRNCIHMEIDFSEHPEMKYKTGDHLGVWPINPDVEVNRLLRVLGLTSRREVPITILSLEEDVKVKVPTPTTLDALLSHYLETCAPVSRETVASLVQFAPAQSAKDLLTRLSSKDAYADFLHSNYVNLGRLLERAAGDEGAWKDVPLSFIVEILPVMQPRYYSISSSSVVQPRSAAITAVVSDTVFPGTNERIPGLSTNYMLALKESLEDKTKPHPHGLTYPLEGPQETLAGGRLHAHVRKSTFKLPALASHPVIMVAAGTGIAPFRAFLQERARMQSIGREVGSMMLFFGCRNEAQDYLYASELADLKAQFGDLFTLVTAFSRPDAGEKKYVQSRVVEHADDVCRLLTDGNANFYICGSASMARDVSNELGRELCKRQSWSEDQLKEFADKQKRFKRWQQDVWG